MGTTAKDPRNKGISSGINSEKSSGNRETRGILRESTQVSCRREIEKGIIKDIPLGVPIASSGAPFP